MSLLTFAELELQILSLINTDPNDRPIVEEFIPQILALVEAVGNSGQSGGSMPYTAHCVAMVVKQLLLYNPITDVTGIDSEWVDVTEYNGGQLLYQNKRCSALFKSDDEGLYYLDAIAFKDTINKYSFTGTVRGLCSRQCIKGFPFVPKTFHVEVEEVPYNSDIHDDYYENSGVKTAYNIISGSDTLDEIFDYYKATNEYSKYYLVGVS
jgi:hypothetical protein